MVPTLLVVAVALCLVQANVSKIAVLVFLNEEKICYKMVYNTLPLG